MARTDTLRRQHDRAMEIAQHLRTMTRHYRRRDDAVSIATELARLLGLLRIHLAQEDQSLYPAMMASSDPQAATLARDYQREMGDLALVLEGFMQRWCSSTVIALKIDEFRTDLDRLLTALALRIERENQFLYPLADSLDGPAPAPVLRVA